MLSRAPLLAWSQRAVWAILGAALLALLLIHTEDLALTASCRLTPSTSSKP